MSAKRHKELCKRGSVYTYLLLLGKVNKYPHTIFIIYFNNSRDLTIISFFNIVPVLCNSLVPAFQKLLDALRKKCLWLSSKPLMHSFFHFLV